jgi:hypothetical protein
MLAAGALLTACSDDTTSQTTEDMPAVVVHDMAMPIHDLAQQGD